ncbi:hypothetical protein LA080_006232 [Diaporthe eres]|nr:hypothetical protein LA080_006232 [Diaporthe eres]
MAASSSTEPQRVTFGIELEFLVPYLWSDEADPEADTDGRQVIRLSQEDMGPGEVFLTAHDRVKNILRDFLRSHEIPVNNNNTAQETGPPCEYSIGGDSSVREFGLQQYHFTGVELRSPALFTEPSSFTEIKRVLHAPERILSQHCPSIRHWSHLAQGESDNWRLAEKELEELRQYFDLPSPSSTARDGENPAERLPPVRTNPYQDEGARGRYHIEFREATGSLDPSWVAAWAKTCSMIVEFCLEAEENAFADLLQRLLEAELAFEDNGGEFLRYDVVDLLNDLGLRNEAGFVEQKILMGDRNVFWFPCALGNSPDDPSSASIMVPAGDED